MSLTPGRPFNRRLSALLAAAGVLCSVALELAHYQAYVDPTRASFCAAGARFDCTTVALSSWSVFLGVPLPLWGAAGFLTIGVLAWWRSTWLLPVTAFSALVSLGLLGVELFAVHSVCILCEVVHLTTFALFALALRGRAELTSTDRVSLAQLATCAATIPICVRLMMAPYWATYSWRSGVHLPTGVDEQGRPWVGAREPKVVVHEYVDYSCPHCALATNHSRRLLAKHPSTMRIVRHQYPRMKCLRTPELMHCLYTRVALCAGDQGAFWQADSWLFEQVSGRLIVDFHKAAADLHLDYDKLTSCMASEQTFDRASKEMDDARAHHIVDAPSYVIDGKRYVGGEAFVELKKLL